MSGLLYGVGGFAVVVGVLAVGFGIPANEGSFGNTLIGAGTTAAVGGLIIIALGVAVTRLERIVEGLTARPPIRPARSAEVPEMPAVAAPGRSPFPPIPKSDPDMRGPYPLEQRMAAPAPVDRLDPEYPVQGRATHEYRAERNPDQDYPAQEYIAQDYAAQSFAPTLRNPEEPPATVEEEVSLPPAANAPKPTPFAINGSGMPGKRQENRQESAPDAGWQQPLPQAAPAPTRQPQTAYFDNMWPDQPKPAKSPAGADAKAEPRRDQSLREALAAPAKRLPSEPRAGAAILKSGVVDGMGYTLYVDGSIEAELPQGTLRFASINELRSHLEKSA
jgi:hypothetical protein